MYSAVRTYENDYPESEMDDRESLYFDTISLAESEAAAVAAHRKSLSQSRNTIYHSAVDLAGDEASSKRSSLRLDHGKILRNANGNNRWDYNNRHSTPLASYDDKAGGHEDATDAALSAQIFALQNGRTNLTSCLKRKNDVDRAEVSSDYLQNSNNLNNDKKLPITYSQWKFRTRRRFRDGTRVVDFVLAYDGNDNCLEHCKKREIFEKRLEAEGLELERDNSQRVYFVKLHASLETLCRYAEILKIKLPMKKIPGQDQIKEEYFSFSERLHDFYRWACKCVQLNPKKFPGKPYRIYCEFSRSYKHLFDYESPEFFNSGMRNMIVNCILERQNFIEGEETPDNLGIEKLLEDGVYSNAYALHDEDDRHLLLKEWANLKKWKNLQPLDKIKDYFGPKIALYYAWLGFYTSMLVPVSILGMICFIYGLLTWNDDPISRQICNDHNQTLMCPQCDRSCDFWHLSNICNSSKMNYLIDNKTTVIFSSIIALWAVLYLELWKRYSAGLVHRWGLTGFSLDVENPRPQYLEKLKKSKKLKGKVDQYNHSIMDADVPYWSTKFLPNFTSYAIMLLFICISVIAIFSIVIYRMAQHASHSILGNEDSVTHKIMVLPITAGLIDLIVISILDIVYSNLAVRLTNLEYCRTQTEYNESLTIKNYAFQFVNYYSSLFYIAFLKGKFVGYPAKYNRILGFRQEECNPGGCLMELCMQLVIIMVGKQAVNAIVEMLIPFLTRMYANYMNKKKDIKEKLVACNQWTEDYHLTPWTNDSLFNEYLEIVMQYGFITLFGLAFPLAPLLALINNVIEVRLDGIKMLKYFRRPVAQRSCNIGVWYNILTVLTKMVVATNAMIIAFSTNLIPKLIYKTVYNDVSTEGYLNFTLAYFNTEDFQVKPLLQNSPYSNVTSCRYTEFRNPPWHEQKYKRPMIYFKILIARLAFIVIFQNVIGFLQTIIAWAIPDISAKLLKRIKRENFLIRENIIEYEKKSAAEKEASKIALDAQQVGEYELSRHKEQEEDNVNQWCPNCPNVEKSSRYDTQLEDSPLMNRKENPTETSPV